VAAPAKPPAPSALKKLLKGGVWTLLGRVWTAAAAVVAVSVWARVLPHEEMGDFNLAQTLVTYGAIVGCLGFNVLVVRLASTQLALERPALARRAILRSFAVTAISAIVMGVVYFFVAPYALPKYQALVAGNALMALWLILVPLGAVTAEAFRGLHEIRNSVLFGGAAFQAIYIGSAAVLSLSSGFGFTAMLVLAVSAASLNLLIGQWLLYRHLTQLGGADDIETPPEMAVGALLSESLPLMLNLLLGIVIATLDVWIVALWYDRDVFANYGLAARIVLVLIMPIAIVQGVIPPMIAELHELNKKAELETLLQGTTTASALASLVPLAGAVLLGPWLITLLFGADFAPAATTLLILAVGQAVSLLAGSPNFVLMMTGRQRIAAVIGVGAVVVLFAAAWPLGRLWGANGVAAAAALGLAVYKIALALVAWRTLGVKTWFDPTFASVWRLAHRGSK
jgi:O-antigen/teichoic acid export membrane protein